MMSSSAAGQPFFDIAAEDDLPFRETYLMESAARCRIDAKVRPEMLASEVICQFNTPENSVGRLAFSVPKSVIDMLMQTAEQMNASATDLIKKILIEEEHLDYLEKAQGREQMRDPAAFKIPRFKLPESILPKAEAEELQTSMTTEIEKYRDDYRNNLFEGAKKFRKRQIEVLKLEHKQLNEKSRHTFVKEWEERFDVSLNPDFGIKILNHVREEYDQEGGRLPAGVQPLDDKIRISRLCFESACVLANNRIIAFAMDENARLRSARKTREDKQMKMAEVEDRADQLSMGTSSRIVEKTLMEMSARASTAAVNRITADVVATAVAKVVSMRDSLSSGTGLGRNPTGSTRGALNPQMSHMRSELPPDIPPPLYVPPPTARAAGGLIVRPTAAGGVATEDLLDPNTTALRDQVFDALQDGLAMGNDQPSGVLDRSDNFRGTRDNDSRATRQMQGLLSRSERRAEYARWHRPPYQRTDSWREVGREGNSRQGPRSNAGQSGRGTLNGISNRGMIQDFEREHGRLPRGRGGRGHFVRGRSHRGRES